MPYCPYCRIQVAGNTCPKCGRALVPPPPTRPQQPPAQRVAPAPPPPSQAPQYRQTAPQRPAAYQPVAQQPQVQPRYQMPPATAPAPVAPAPPKKSRKGAVIAVVCVVAILLIATLAYLFVFKQGEEDDAIVKPGATVTAKQFGEDWNPIIGTFKGLDDGDTVIIRDGIKEIEHIGTGSPIYGNVNWTLITFESTEMTLDGFYSGDFPVTDLFGLIIFSGDLSNEYQPGDKVDVEITIADYTIEDQTAELPEWYVDIMEAYAGNMDFEDIEFQDSSTISHTGE